MTSRRFEPDMVDWPRTPAPRKVDRARRARKSDMHCARRTGVRLYGAAGSRAERAAIAASRHCVKSAERPCVPQSLALSLDGEPPSIARGHQSSRRHPRVSEGSPPMRRLTFVAGGAGLRLDVHGPRRAPQGFPSRLRQDCRSLPGRRRHRSAGADDRRAAQSEMGTDGLRRKHQRRGVGNVGAPKSRAPPRTATR